MSTSMLRRQLKNIVQNFSEAEIKVREATSNDPWGPSSSLMAEISDLTYNVVACSEIMTMVWKRLNDSGKNWRHVYKAMTLLDYLLKTGSDRVAKQCHENIYVLQTLREFQFIDRDGKDQGVNVREKAKQLVTLLKDEEKLKEERAHALKTKEKMAQTTSASSTSPAPPVNLANRPGGLQLGGVASLTSLTKAPVGGANGAEPQTAGDVANSKEDREQKADGGSSDPWGAPAAPADSSAPPAGSDPWGAPGASQPANTDPWGGPATAAPAQSDPWGEGGISANPSADPWGDSSKASNDPWGSTAAVSPPGGDPWAASTAATGDPWGADGGAPAAVSTTSDPWGGPAKDAANGANTGDQKLSDVTAGGGGEEVGGIAGAPASLDLSSISAALPAKKTPESFLGANASLVDLDSLVSSKPKPKPSGPPMASMVTKPSPFAQSQGTSPAPAMAVRSVGTIFRLGFVPCSSLCIQSFWFNPIILRPPISLLVWAGSPSPVLSTAPASPITSGRFQSGPETGA